MNRSKTAIKLGILAQPFVATMIGVPSVMMAAIAAAFPGVSRTGLQLILVLGTFAMFISSLIAGSVSGKVRKKSMSLFALAILLLSGIVVLLLHDSITYFYLSGILCGGGTGLLLTNVTILNTVHFEGQERSKMFGYQNAVQNIGSVVIKLVAGALGATLMVNAYYSYALVVLSFVIVLFALPGEPAPVKSNTQKKAEKVSLPGSTWLLCIVGLLGMACAVGITYNGALYIAKNNIGDPAFSALALSMMVAAAAVAGLVYQFIQKKTRAFSLTVAFAIAAIGYFLLALFPGQIVVMVAIAFAGFGYGLIAPSCIQAITDITTPQQASKATGGMVACCGIGIALTPFIFNPLAVLIPVFASVEATIFLLCGIGFVILSIFAAVWYPAVHRKRPVTELTETK